MINFDEFQYLTKDNVDKHLENFYHYVYNLMTRSIMGVAICEETQQNLTVLINELFEYQKQLITQAKEN